MSVKTFKEGIKLDPQSADPTATEGQVQFADGTVRPKGLYQYKDGAWSGIGGGAGDADTIHLIKANDSQASDFSLKSIDDVLPDFEGSDTLAGTFSIPTTGSEALLSNDDDHKVFKFASAASSQYDAWGISKAIPRYIRGEDIVLQFKYRTAETTGATANADYMIWLWDKTNGQNETTTSSGSVSAGTAITIGSSTGMAVGDKIWVGETGGTSQVTEAHITEITSGTQIKISEDINLTSGDRFVTGILTDVLTTLDAADDDTNKTGNDYKVVANIPSDCSEVTLMFQQLTAQTDSFLFVDNILISSEVVKRIHSIPDPVRFLVEGNGGEVLGGAADVPFATVAYNKGGGTWDGTVFTIPRDSTYVITSSIRQGSTNNNYRLYVNGSLYKNFTTGQNSFQEFAQFNAEFQAGDELKFVTGQAVTLVNTSTEHWFAITEIPSANDVVVVESTDSVISEWTNFTPTGLWTTNTTYTGKWRRVGDTMQVSVNASLSGAPNAGNMYFDLPSGYVIDTSKLPDTTVGIGFLGSGTAHDSGTGSETIEIRYKDTTSVYAATYDGSAFIGVTVPFTWASADDLNAYFEVPIAGWDANPKPLLALPTVTYGQEPEEYIAYGGGDEASANTALPYWTTVNKDTTGNSVSITNDSTNGFLLTALQRVKVSLSGVVYDASDNTIKLVVVKNHDDYTESESSVRTNHPDRVIDYAIDLGDGTASPRNNSFSSVPFILDAGDIISIHSEKTLEAEADNRIRVFAEPIHGQVNQAAIISQPVAFVKDVKASGTNGGTFTSGAWQTRDLNTLSGDIAAVGVTLSSNQFTLPAGKYCIEAVCPFSQTEHTRAKIYNITDSKDEALGVCLYNETTTGGDTASVQGLVTITKSTTFEIQNRCATTFATYGFGRASTFGVDEIYTTVKITRMK